MSVCDWCEGGECQGPVIGRIGPGVTLEGAAVRAQLSAPNQTLNLYNCTVYIGSPVDSRPDQGVGSASKDEGGGTDGAGPEDAVPVDSLTLDNEISLWSRDLAADGKGTRTRQNYESVIRSVAAPQLDAAGNVARRRWDSSADFTRGGVVEYLTALKLDAGRAGKTVNNHRTIIRSFLTRFRPKCAYWFEGPEKIRSAKVKKGRGDKRALTWPELQSLLATAGKHRDMYLVAYGTALRRGALCDSERDGRCLRVKHFHLGEHPRVHVPKEVDKMGVERNLPLAPWVAAFIGEIIDRDRLGPEDMLFDHSCHPGTMRDDFDRAGIVARNHLGLAATHSLKYTFNTVLTALGIPERVRQELMSHAAESITDRIYLTPELLMTAMEDAVAMLPDPRKPGIPPYLGKSSRGDTGPLDERPMIGYLTPMPLANGSTRTSETRLLSAASGIKAEGGRVSVLREDEVSRDLPVSSGSDSSRGSESEWAIQDSNLYPKGEPRGSGSQVIVDADPANRLIPQDKCGDALARPSASDAAAAVDWSVSRQTPSRENHDEALTDDRTPREGTDSHSPAADTAGLPYPVVATGRTPCATADSAYGGAGSIPAGVTSTDAYARFVGEAVAAAWAARRNGGAL